MPTQLNTLTGKETLAELRARIDGGEEFVGLAVLPGGDAETDSLTGPQFPMFVTLAMDDVLNDRGDTVLTPAMDASTPLEVAVANVRRAYRLSQRQMLFGVITEWRQRRARRLADPNAIPSPATQRAMETWLGVLTRGQVLGGLNTHIDTAVRQTPVNIRNAIAEKIWGVSTQGEWQLMRVKLAGQFGAWRYARRNDPTTGEPYTAEQRAAQAVAGSGAAPEGEAGDGAALDEEPF